MLLPASLLLPTLVATSLAAEFPAAHPVVTTLDNGLTVIVEQQARTDVVVLYLKYRVGSRDERDGEKGLAHLFEHLMFERSANVPQDAFDTWLTAAGGDNNAYTGIDETVYHMVFPSAALDLALFLESDRMGFLDAALDVENLENQKAVVLQERATRLDAPYGKVAPLAQRAQFGAGHPYSVAPIGTLADVQGFDLERVRAFWDRHYRARNAVLVIVGNVDPAHALERVAYWFRDVPDRGAAPARVGRPPDWRFQPVDMLAEDDVEERTVALLWPAVEASHPDVYALDILADVLSGGRGTRLDDRLYYGSNLATSISAGRDSAALQGSFIVEATSPRTPLTTLVRRIDGVIAQVASRGVTTDEVARAVRGRVHGLLDVTETARSRAEIYLACFERHGDPDCLAREAAAYEAVTADDVQRVARTYLHPRRRSTLSVVPRGDDGALPGAQAMEVP